MAELSRSVVPLPPYKGKGNTAKSERVLAVRSESRAKKERKSGDAALAQEIGGDETEEDSRDEHISREDSYKMRLKKRITLPHVKGYWP